MAECGVLEEVPKHGFVERGLILLEMEQRMLLAVPY